MTGSLAIRMYNVGFGDCHLVRVNRDGRNWRMLVDCGVHSQGNRDENTNGITSVVERVIADLREDCEGDPHLNVVAATHRHADHVSGFAVDNWTEVAVDEVWLPFVEDMSDPDGDALRRGVQYTSEALLTSAVLARVSGGSPELRVVTELAENARPNQAAVDRLLGLGGQHFRNRPKVRYWPNRDPAENEVDLVSAEGVLPDAVIHMLGPPRDPAFLKKMHPPKDAEWLHLGSLTAANADARSDIFGAEYQILRDELLPIELQQARKRSGLRSMSLLDDTLLGAAVRLDRVVNNTSLFMILEVGDAVLVLPGDAQQGAWDHVRSSTTARALLSRCTVYKIGHHGSHNATPRAFLEEDWKNGGGHALLPWGPVKAWPEIPKRTLMDELAASHGVVRFEPQSSPEVDVAFHPNGDWVELTIAI